MTTPAMALRGTSGRSVEEAVSYAIGHRIRIEILAALHEGPASANDLSRALRVSHNSLGHHIEQLVASGSIEVADTRKVGNVIQYIYRAITSPEYTSEEFEAMSEEERQVTIALILQASMAESLAALWAGKLVNDPRLMLAWHRIGLDKQGRDDLADEQDRSWLRIREIEAEAASRRIESGEPGETYVVTSFGFPRSQPEVSGPVEKR